MFSKGILSNRTVSITVVIALWYFFRLSHKMCSQYASVHPVHTCGAIYWADIVGRRMYLARILHSERFDWWSCASRHIRGGTRTNRLVSRFMRSPRAVIGRSHQDAQNALYVHARNAPFRANARTLSRAVSLHFSARSSFARNFRLTSMISRDVIQIFRFDPFWKRRCSLIRTCNSASRCSRRLLSVNEKLNGYFYRKSRWTDRFCRKINYFIFWVSELIAMGAIGFF